MESYKEDILVKFTAGYGCSAALLNQREFLLSSFSGTSVCTLFNCAYTGAYLPSWWMEARKGCHPRRRQYTCIHVPASNEQKITYCKFNISVLCMYCYLAKWKQNYLLQNISYKVLVKTLTCNLCNISWCFLSYGHLLYSNHLLDVFYDIRKKSQNDGL